METREHIRQINQEHGENVRIIMGSRSPSGLPTIVEVPSLPEPPPPSLRLGGHAAELPDRLSQSRKELEAARGELQALDHLLELEESKLAGLQGTPRSPQTADFIKLARQEVGSEYERLDNYFKRRQNMSHHRSNTSDSGVADMSVAGSPVLRPAETLRRDTASTEEANGETRDETFLSSSASYPRPSPVLRSQSGLYIDVSQEPVVHGSDAIPQPTTGRSTLPQRSGSLDSLSKTKDKFLQQFQRELAEIDDSFTPLPESSIPIETSPATSPRLDQQEDLEAEIQEGIHRTKSLFRRSGGRNPQSPRLELSNSGSPTAIATGSVSSSPPATRISPQLSFPQSMQSPNPELLSRPSFPLLTQSFVPDEKWNWVAKDVRVVGVHYICRYCPSACPTALQYARRSGSNGLSFRLQCLNSCRDHTDARLFRHDLSSSSNPFPHIFHSRADPGSARCVLVRGVNKRLDVHNRGQVTALAPQAQIKYQFRNAEDWELFQQLICGMILKKKFDIPSVRSSLSTGPTGSETLRIWQDTRSDELVLMTCFALGNEDPSRLFYERRSAFTSLSLSGETRVKLKTTDPNRLRRRQSRDSGVSGLSSGTGESLSGGNRRVEWLLIEFNRTEDRSEFLSVWKA